jgi:hypothetical protein
MQISRRSRIWSPKYDGKLGSLTTLTHNVGALAFRNEGNILQNRESHMGIQSSLHENNVVNHPCGYYFLFLQGAIVLNTSEITN